MRFVRVLNQCVPLHTHLVPSASPVVSNMRPRLGHQAGCGAGRVRRAHGHKKTLIRRGQNEPTEDGANDERKPVLEAR